MENYKNVLLGTNLFSDDWTATINNINKNNIIITDFSNINNLHNIIITKNISYIIPLSDKDNNLITNNKLQLSNNIKILYPVKKTQYLLHNKVLFTEFMLKYFNEFIPDVYFLNNKKIKDIEYPAIYKPTYSTNGKNMIIIYNHQDLLQLKNKNIIQKFIEDQYEYSAYMLCIDGIIINYKIIRYKFKMYHIKTSNFPIDYENVTDFNIDIFSNIIIKLNYSGGINFNFKFNDIANKLYIFEINPRFGGSAFTCNFIYELLCIT